MEVISARISRRKGNLECLEIIMLEKCKNKPIFLVDRAPWYKEVLSRRELKYEIRTRGKRNSVESWFFQVEEEGENFYKRFPANSSIKAVESWILSFITT